MRLTRPMLCIFAQVTHSVSTIEALARAQGKSLNWTTEVIQQLEEEGFIVKKKHHRMKGSRIIIEVAPTPHALALKKLLFEYSTIQFENLLADSKLLFLAAVSEDWMDTTTAARLSEISRYVIDRWRPMLKNRGIIVQQGSLYRVNEKAWPTLKEFLLAYKNYSPLPGVVKWKFQNEVLFEVDKETIIQGTLTGLAAYEKYGVMVGVISFLCVLPERKLSKEEIFVHSLFEVDDPRTLHLALTFYLKNKLSYRKVMPIAMKYGKYTMFENMMHLLKTKEEKMKFEGLPPFERKDFIRIAHMYGVENV